MKLIVARIAVGVISGTFLGWSLFEAFTHGNLQKAIYLAVVAAAVEISGIRLEQLMKSKIA